MNIIQSKTYKRHSFIGLILICLLALSCATAVITGVSLTPPVFAQQETFKGEWVADLDEKSADKEKLYFRIIRRTERGSQDNSSNNISLTEMQGLTREQVFGRDFRHVAASRERCGRDVRHNQAVRQCQQLVIAGQRLWFGHVQGGAGDDTVAQGVVQIVWIDHRSA